VACHALDPPLPLRESVDTSEAHTDLAVLLKPKDTRHDGAITTAPATGIGLVLEPTFPGRACHGRTLTLLDAAADADVIAARIGEGELVHAP
jgi:hypothetical protein